MNRFFASALLLGVIGSEAVATLAEAACNAIPSVDQISASQPSLLPPPLAPASSTTLNTAITNFGYKGALGRVDRVHLLPTAARKEPSSPDAPAMVVVADGVCIDPDGRLFSLADAINNPGSLAPVPTTGTIVLDPTLTMGGPHKRRGVCKANPAKSCGNGTGPGACSQGDCRGYQLQAGRVQ
jgi:hypothetical protein